MSTKSLKFVMKKHVFKSTEQSIQKTYFILFEMLALKARCRMNFLEK